MSEFNAHPRITITATFSVDEEELRALDALAGYGSDSFVKAFYEFLGKAYMRDHEKGLRRFLDGVRAQVPSHLAALKRARNALK